MRSIPMRHHASRVLVRDVSSRSCRHFVFRGVPMPMMDVGKMWMTVRKRLVRVFVGMRLARRVMRSVRMTMMLVMQMPVAVRERLVRVRVRVPLREVQPQPERHESR